MGTRSLRAKIRLDLSIRFDTLPAFEVVTDTDRHTAYAALV